MLAFVASCLTFGVVKMSTHLVVLILMMLLFIMMTLTGESVPVAMPFLMMVMVLLLVTAAAAVTLTFDFCSDFFHSFLDTGICNLLCDVGGISQLLLRGARLSSQQKQQLASYNPRRRDADKLRRRAQMHMLRGKSFDEAVLLAEGRDASELNPRARPATATPASAIRRTGRNSRRFIDDTASV